ncbi:MAG: anthrone oxygenase family protein [Pseudomonadota bacterium]
MPLEITIALGALTLATALVGGVFMAFSDFIMRSFAFAGPTTGTDAMQAINRQIIRSVFVPLLIALAPLSVLLALYAGVALNTPAAGWIVAGSAIYVGGAFIVTITRNVPMNNRLDALSAPDAADYWQIYLRDWTRWNHARSGACAVAATCYFIASNVG